MVHENMLIVAPKWQICQWFSTNSDSFESNLTQPTRPGPGQSRPPDLAKLDGHQFQGDEHSFATHFDMNPKNLRDFIVALDLRSLHSLHFDTISNVDRAHAAG